MADISKLKIGSNTYDVKDPTARTTANNADSNASQAILDSAEANAKISGSSIVGTYTAGTETLEISFQVGSVQSNNGGE